MKNEAGQYVDLYIPQKCSMSNKIIHAQDHGSVQINLAEVDEHGVATTKVRSFVVASHIRQSGESDGRLADLFTAEGITCVKSDN